MVFERIFFLFIFLLFIPVAIYIPNPSGVGLALPFNLLICGGAALLMAVCWRVAPLRDTLAIIAEKALTGWGYGGFEYSFQHFRINQTPPTVVTEIARHPYNELLRWGYGSPPRGPP